MVRLDTDRVVVCQQEKTPVTGGSASQVLVRLGFAHLRLSKTLLPVDGG